MAELVLGWKAGPEQFGPQELIDYAVTAEQAGFEKDPDEHVAFAQRYLDMGFDHLVFHCPMPDQQQFLEDYGREVLPRLRARLQLSAA